MQGSLKVSGRGVVSAAPDLIKASVRMEGVCDTYERAAAAFEACFEGLKASIAEGGFSPKELKTVDFGINTFYRDERSENNVWNRIFGGYKFSHSLEIAFSNDSRLMGAFVAALSKCESVENFGFAYAVRDLEKLKNEAVEKAVVDARSKAVVLADAAKIRLGRILSVIYNPVMREQATQRVYRMSADTCPASSALDINARELTFEETVDFEWELL